MGKPRRPHTFSPLVREVLIPPTSRRTFHEKTSAHARDRFVVPCRNAGQRVDPGRIQGREGKDRGVLQGGQGQMRTHEGQRKGCLREGSQGQGERRQGSTRTAIQAQRRQRPQGRRRKGEGHLRRREGKVRRPEG